MTTTKIGKPRNHRELRIFSAGQAAGMRNYAMAQAATKSKPKAERAKLVKMARDFHHTYLQRLREAAGAPGYHFPFANAPVECGKQTKAEAA